MVVKGLERFVENIPGGMFSSNLRELITKNSNSGDGKPTVILDASSVCGLLESDMGFLHQGRPRIDKNKIEKFVEDIMACGTNLIVVLRGNLSLNLNRNKNKWSTRQNYVNKSLERNDLNEALRNIFSSRLRSCHATTFAGISRNGYEVYTSIETTHEEIGKIVIKRNCLAVLGQDSDYLIHEGIKYYISLHKMNKDTLDCQVYDRKKMLEYLELQSYQLPLLATLCGNDVIHFYQLNNFHKKISSTPPTRDRIQEIAKIVRKTSPNPYEHVKEVVHLINCPTINESLVSKSLDMYLKFETETSKNAQMKFANQRKRMNEWGNFLYTLFVTKEFYIKSASALFGSNDQFCKQLLRPLRQRVYGIVLHEDCSPFVKEYYFDNWKHPSEIKPELVQALKPNSKHPGLFQLWDKNTPNLNVLKWDLFFEQFQSSLNCCNLKKIPLNLLFLVLALHYLEIQIPSTFGRKVFKKRSELEAFLVGGLLLQADLHEPLLDNFQDDSPDLHVVYLNHCFTETVSVLNLLNEACGLAVPKQETCICNFYDGKLVHYIQKKMKEGASSDEFFRDQFTLKSTFNCLLEFILNTQ